MGYLPLFEKRVASVNTALDGFFGESCLQSELLEAMRYGLLSGGKRIRAVLVLAFCSACGGDEEAIMNAACAIEMLHAYSLIHDDLPCMDNDTLRRGKPTCHVVYGETNAVLAGDALQAAAFSALLRCPLDGDKLSAMALALADAAGERGMCGGQYLDTSNDPAEVDDEYLTALHAMKTGALIRASCLMGAIGAGANEEQLRAATNYAENLGVAFQIRDDVLDAVGEASVIGKNVGSDAAKGKATCVTLYGLEGCEKMVRDYTMRAVTALESAFPNETFLRDLALSLIDRKK